MYYDGANWKWGDEMKLQELLEMKNEAIISAANELSLFIEPCSDDSCEPSSNPPYHWRGCKNNLKPLIDRLIKASMEE